MTEKRFVSLNIKPLLAFFFGVVLGVLVYLFVNYTGTLVIEKTYMTDSAVASRAWKTAQRLQAYVRENNLTAGDTEALSRWGAEQGSCYIALYRNQQFVGEIGWWGSDSSMDSYSFDASSSGYTYPVVFRGVTYQAVVYDFSEADLYNILWIAALVLGFGTVALVLFGYSQRVTKAIVAASAEVRAIGEGNLYLQLEPKGNDELTQLTASVEQMRLSLLRKTSEEQRALQQNSDLITAMSHDIRNPLTALLGYLDLAKNGQYRSAEELQSYLDAAHGKAEQLKSLTDELFRYSLLFGCKELPLQLESYDAGLLLEQLLGENRAILQQQGFSVQLLLPQTACRIRVDVTYFKRVLDNLFDNIRKYADPAKPVAVAAIVEDGALHICLSNSVSQGSGRIESNKIGLRTCAKIMTQMGGGFSRYTESGKFTAEVILPIEPDMEPGH